MKQENENKKPSRGDIIFQVVFCALVIIAGVLLAAKSVQAEGAAFGYEHPPAPLGLKWGITPEEARQMGVSPLDNHWKNADELTTHYPNDGGKHRITTVPKPIPDAEYTLVFHDKLGLIEVWLWIMGGTYANPDIYHRYLRVLTQKYGTPGDYGQSAHPRLRNFVWDFPNGNIRIIGFGCLKLAAADCEPHDEVALRIIYDRWEWKYLFDTNKKMAEDAL